MLKLIRHNTKPSRFAMASFAILHLGQPAQRTRENRQLQSALKVLACRVHVVEPEFNISKIAPVMLIVWINLNRAQESRLCLPISTSIVERVAKTVPGIFVVRSSLCAAR